MRSQFLPPPSFSLSLTLSLFLLPLTLSHPPPSLLFLTQYMFVSELDGSKKRAVHDELARLLVQYLKKKFENPQRLTMVLDVSVCVCGGEGGGGVTVCVCNTTQQAFSMSTPSSYARTHTHTHTYTHTHTTHTHTHTAPLVLPGGDVKEHGTIPHPRQEDNSEWESYVQNLI